MRALSPLGALVSCRPIRPQIFFEFYLPRQLQKSPDTDSRRTIAHSTMSEWLGRIYSGRHHVRLFDAPADNHPASNRCNVEAADKLLDVSKMM